MQRERKKEREREREGGRESERGRFSQKTFFHCLLNGVPAGSSPISKPVATETDGGGVRRSATIHALGRIRMNVVERLSEILCATREMEVWVDSGARTSCACVEDVWESKRGERETDIEGDT